MNPITLVKNHPVISAVAAVVLVAVIVVSMSGGDEQVASDTGGGYTSTGPSESLQAAALQSQAAQYAASAAKEVALAESANKYKIAELDSRNNAAASSANLTINTKQIEASKSVQSQGIAAQLAATLRQLVSTDKANTLSANLEAQRIRAEMAEDAAQQSTLQKQIESQKLISLAAIGAQTAIAKDSNNPKGLFSWLFG